MDVMERHLEEADEEKLFNGRKQNAPNQKGGHNLVNLDASSSSQAFKQGV